MLKQLRNCDLIMLYVQKPAQVKTMSYKFHLAQVEGKKTASSDNCCVEGQGVCSNEML